MPGPDDAPASVGVRDWPLDRVEALEPRRRCVAVKLISFGDPIFDEHFPERPVYPGSMQLNSAFAAALHMMNAGGQRWRVCGVERVVFRRPCPAGEILTIETTAGESRGPAVAVRFSAKGSYGGAVLSTGVFVVEVVP
jgi:3-hydroxyacyl-[acyl-carrier-protein] dehydratase